MSLAGAFSSAASMPGEDRVDSKGEFSLVKVCSRSERPLFVAAVEVAAGLEEAMDPIKAFIIYIGSKGQSFSWFDKSLRELILGRIECDR